MSFHKSGMRITAEKCQSWKSRSQVFLNVTSAYANVVLEPNIAAAAYHGLCIRCGFILTVVSMQSIGGLGSTSAEMSPPISVHYTPDSFRGRQSTAWSRVSISPLRYCKQSPYLIYNKAIIAVLFYWRIYVHPNNSIWHTG